MSVGAQLSATYACDANFQEFVFGCGSCRDIGQARSWLRVGSPLRQVGKMPEKSVQLCKILKFCGNNVAIVGNMTP